MKKIAIISFAVIALAALLPSCTPAEPSADAMYVNESQVASIIADGKLFDLNEFKDSFMTDTGNFCRPQLYRKRAEITGLNSDYRLFSIDTLPIKGPGIYVRGRISTDDYGGNFYKSMVIQQRMPDGTQQNLRISIDMGSCNGLYQMGQEVIIRCNGLSLGRYANQAQLCIPSYNNNTLAQHADEKVGWAPGRIPGPIFRKACTLIGTPDASKLLYDTITIADFKDKTDLYSLREYCIKDDGRLVIIKKVHFTGQYSNYGTPTDCTTGDPSKDENANVFAPTTNNLNFPQGRIIADEGGNPTIVSTSEYAKYAYFYLPNGSYVGSVCGILGAYADNGLKLMDNMKTGKEKEPSLNLWSITPRGLSTPATPCKINDILWDNTDWVPQEWSKPDEEGGSKSK